MTLNGFYQTLLMGIFNLVPASYFPWRWILIKNFEYKAKETWRIWCDGVQTFIKGCSQFSGSLQNPPMSQLLKTIQPFNIEV